jgi:nitroreductase
MRSEKLFRLNLRAKDKILIICLIALVLLLTMLTSFYYSPTLIFLCAGLFGIFLVTVLIESYRRVEVQLRPVEKRYIMMDIYDVIRTRRSVRKFLQKPIREIDIKRMLKAACWAPNGGRTQPWHFIVVQDPQMIARMKKIVGIAIDDIHQSASFRGGWRQSTMFFADAPMVLAVLMKRIHALYPDDYVDWIINKKDCNKQEAYEYMGDVELMSVAAAIENLLLTAHSLGYGACWLRIPFMAKDKLEHLFNVDSPWQLTAIIPVGHPAYIPSAPERKKVDEVATFITS